MTEYHGQCATFYVGNGNDKVEIQCWTDDGTRGEHITIFYNNIPVGTFPVVDRRGFERLVSCLSHLYEYKYPTPFHAGEVIE